MAVTEHVLYDNFVLENTFENFYNGKMDLMDKVTVDNSLVAVAGDKVQVNVYDAEGDVEELARGEGNTSTIKVSYTKNEYEVKLLQEKFEYCDEDIQKDPQVLEVGLQKMSAVMFNKANALAMAEFNKATLSLSVSKFDFDAIADGVAIFPYNEQGDEPIFLLAHPKDIAEFRKNLKGDLDYVEAYVRTGYIGTINGVSLYSTNSATQGQPILATNKAVKYFNKAGVSMEQDRDSDKRINYVYARKVGVFAFVDATQAVKLVKA